ncbi:MAG: M20/M25/M40 family metallo-hydrolase [Caldilineaceae bacterium]
MAVAAVERRPRDGKVHGRGSCDMKAGLVAGIFALSALCELGYQPAHDILLQSVIGEESGGWVR